MVRTLRSTASSQTCRLTTIAALRWLLLAIWRAHAASTSPAWAAFIVDTLVFTCGYGLGERAVQQSRSDHDITLATFSSKCFLLEDAFIFIASAACKVGQVDES